jgi:hypothetical protein
MNKKYKKSKIYKIEEKQNTIILITSFVRHWPVVREHYKWYKTTVWYTGVLYAELPVTLQTALRVYEVCLESIQQF